jgi:sec-independent protein translocase protein TatC
MSQQDTDPSAMSLVDHLTELRTRVIRALGAFVVAMVLCFTVAEPILNFLAEPISDVLRARGQDPRLIFTAPQEKFFVLIRISMLGGLALAFPIIAFQLWRFIAPGLYREEKAAFMPFVLASPILFVLGAAFAHYIVTPLAMNFFIGFSDVIPALTQLIAGNTGEVAATNEELSTVFLGSVRESLDLTLKFIMAFGLCFQLPVLLTLMGKAGLVSAAGLRDVRKYAVVGILIVAALVTPPDVVTQLILFTVVYGLYEVSIALVAMVDRKRERELRAAGVWDEDIDGPGQVKDDVSK